MPEVRKGILKFAETGTAPGVAAGRCAATSMAV